MTTTDTTYRTITLTDAPPVQICEQDWPQIATGLHRWCNSEREEDSDREVDIMLRVRRHADGRAIVYGVQEYQTHHTYESNLRVRTGALLPAGKDIPACIRRVGRELLERLDSDAWHREHVRRVIDDCIASLPAVTLE